ncbi:dipeptidase [Porphyromonas sp. COT-108 OH1349]|uniref:dipeptidase n=1 Tax=Porphyromonas sp. COT-108 OH1349 TaxID=1537504 RepID=UPI00068A6E6E|nr:C69 family dipeptidase [Porphyromonas sp. COT-108 OH1349]
MNFRSKLLTLVAVLACTSGAYIAEACTGLIVGRKASADGSVIISYSADSHVLYGELYHWDARKWAPNSRLNIVEWDTGKPSGHSIPQVAQTYNVVGNMNEKQVAITESTFGGREELVNPEGIMDYGSLIYVTLQRAASAREAIDIMGKLVEEYGYCSSGESYSIADKNEVWVMEMIGKGPGRKGAVWVAIRIPDDCISGHANQARIQNIPFADKENCVYSKDVVSFAREKGYFKGKDSEFSFQKAYAPYDFGALRGCEARVWSFFNRFVDGMDKYLPFVMGQEMDATPMPLYMKPNRKVSVQDVQNMMRDHYEDTPMDMTKDVGAGPYACPYRWRPMHFEVEGKQYLNERAIATQQTGFVLVAQLRNYLPDYVGGVLWFGVDDADMCVFTPQYCSITSVPDCFKVGNGDLLEFSWTSAFWMHNWVANMAYHKYSYMIKDIRKVQGELENKFFAMQPMIEKYAMELAKNGSEKDAVEFLTNYATTEANGATARWRKLGEYLVVKYIDGNVKKEKDGKFERTADNYPVSPSQPGYDPNFYKAIAENTGDRLLVGPAKTK